MRQIFLTVFCLLLTVAGKAQTALPSHKTENVIIVMTDGLRWKEVFRGAEPSLVEAIGDERERAEVRRTFGQATPEARREALMPFVWTTLARQGQLFGNRDKNSTSRVTNGKNFSYPGYSETLCGFADDRVDSNAKRPNPNVTVFEWLNGMPQYRNRVAAFAAWDVFPFILNTERSGLLVNAGFDPLTTGKMTPNIALLNRLKAETPPKWDAEPWDSFTFYTALEYLRENKPRVLYVSLGETDEWAHEGNYAEYLKAAHRADGYLKQLYDVLQTLPQYRGKTSLIFLPDHGRGDAPDGWKSHGAQLTESQFTWMAFLGPDTQPRGERANVPTVEQNQIAATLAAFLGEDYRKSVPNAGKPVVDVLPTTSTVQ